MVAASTWGALVDGLASTIAREVRRLVHRALVRGVGSRQAVEADLVFHGPSHRLGPAEAATVDSVLSWVRPLDGQPSLA